MRKIRLFHILSVLLISLVASSAWATDLTPCRIYLEGAGPVGIDESAFAPQSFGQTFFKLWKQDKLIHQTDVLLDMKGLLVEGGGLCGPTCVANSVVTAETMKGHAPPAPESLVEDIVDAYTAKTKLDGRVGTFLKELLDASKTLHLRARYRRVDLNRESLSLISSELDSGIKTLLIGAGRHAYLVLAIVDKPVRQLIISNPNIVIPLALPYFELEVENSRIVEFQNRIVVGHPFERINEAYLISWY